MTRVPVPLCNLDELPPLMVEPVENPAFAVKSEADAYLDIDECAALVRDVFVHVAMDMPTIEFGWSKKSSEHGRATKTHDDEYTVRSQELNRRGKDIHLAYRAGRLPLEQFIQTRADLAREAATVRGLPRGTPRYAISFSQKIFAAVAVGDRVQTVVHEACHVVAYLKYPDVNVGHGPRWEALMVKCGVRPDAKAQPSEIAPRVVCPSCGQAARVDPKLILSFRAGATGLCRSCGHRLTLGDLQVPAGYERTVAKSASSSIMYHCPCGATYIITKRYLEAVLAGAIQKKVLVSCHCKRPLLPQHVRVGGKPLTG